jgi:hypothetical protein
MSSNQSSNRKGVFSFIGLLGALMLAGCATTAPTANFSQEITPGYALRARDTAKVALNAAPGVWILDYEKSRLTEVIATKIAARERLNPPAGLPRTYEIDVELTQYEKGDAFARAMLAGLGQIHIAGNVTIYLLPARTTIGEFTLKKTFAWGGIYGAATSMDTIEESFADGIAAAVTGQAGSNDK